MNSSVEGFENFRKRYINSENIVRRLKIRLKKPVVSLNIAFKLFELLAGLPGLGGNAQINLSPNDDMISDESLMKALKEKVGKKKIVMYKAEIFKENNKLCFTAEGVKYTADKQCCEAFKKLDYYENLEAVIFGNRMDNRNGFELFEVAALFQEECLSTQVSEDRRNIIQTGVYGLNRIMFPGLPKEKRGFINPKTSEHIVPQIIIIKGAPGTGKTTLAVQMLVRMAMDGLNCLFWSTNNDLSAIKDIAVDFNFCKKKDLENCINNKNVYINHIGQKSIADLKLPKDIPEHTDILFIDSVNITHRNASVINLGVQNNEREDIAALFDNYRKHKLLAFVFLEDYGEEASYEVRQTILDCESFSDIVVQLSEIERKGYHYFGIKIKKKHYGSQSYGTHLYKICGQNHSLVVLENAVNKARELYHTNNGDYQSGILIYPSIHRYLSGTRKLYNATNYVQTGITHLDEIFQGRGKRGLISDKSMLSDSCIVISGEKGSHKLTLGINLLLGGMWNIGIKKGQKTVRKNKDVLLIMLDGYDDLNLKKVAIAKETARTLEGQLDISPEIDSLDNGRWISWIDDSNAEKKCRNNCQLCELTKQDHNGQKVVFKKCCAEIGPDGEHAKVLIAGFRPGYIPAEEFLHIVSRLINLKGIAATKDAEPAFSRVLFVSTDHLKMRFPLLYNEELFIPALIDLFKSQCVVSIFIDVLGDGSDKKLTYGLSAQADYLIHLTDYSEENTKRSEGEIWTKMLFDNIRGKNYFRPIHAITVREDENGQNTMQMIDIHDYKS